MELQSGLKKVAPAKPPAEGVWPLDPVCQSQHLRFSLAVHSPGSHSFRKQCLAAKTQMLEVEPSK